MKIFLNLTEAQIKKNVKKLQSDLGSLKRIRYNKKDTIVSSLDCNSCADTLNPK
jgi:hypothetical protein